MKLIAIHIYKWVPPTNESGDDQQPFLLCSAMDLSSLWIHKRTVGKDNINLNS